MIKSILIILCVLGVAACGPSKSELERRALEVAAEKEQYNACIGKGVKYYKSLGSYPTLSTGKNADLKIREKCDFNINMFD